MAGRPARDADGNGERQPGRKAWEPLGLEALVRPFGQARQPHREFGAEAVDRVHGSGRLDARERQVRPVRELITQEAPDELLADRQLALVHGHQPNPYTPENRVASSRTRSAPGRPTMFR